MKAYLSLLVSLLTAGTLAAQAAKDAPVSKDDKPTEASPAADRAAGEKDDAAAHEDDLAEAEDLFLEKLTAAAEQAEKDQEAELKRVATEREKAEGEEMDELKTTKGRVFKKVVINKVDDLGISIRHQAGTARVPFELVSKDLQKRFGYSPEMADAQARAEKEQADAFTRAAIAALRAAREENKPGARPSRPDRPTRPASTGTETVASSGDIRVLENKIAVIEKGIAKLELEALDYEEKAANIDRRNVRQLQDGVNEDREGAMNAPKTGAEKWRAKAYAVYDDIEKGRELITKYRREIRALKREAQRK